MTDSAILDGLLKENARLVEVKVNIAVGHLTRHAPVTSTVEMSKVVLTQRVKGDGCGKVEELATSLLQQ